VRTSPWLAHIARTTSAGKSWRRVRVVGWPLTEYERYQMIGYRVSAATGDVIRIAGRSAHPELAAPGPGRPPWRLVAISANWCASSFLVNYAESGKEALWTCS